MTGKIAVKVENLNKKYVIGHENTHKNDSFREVVGNAFKQLIPLKRKIKTRIPSEPTEDFWALKEICFEVKQGDKLGIIGRNGAGKSTLLKVLSQITEPTSGKIQINGRIACLLEVGTGFHPELTGRENIYLNGAVLGMCRNEIKSKFDEIVAFAEVDKFLDTPVKRYSSGMYVRLAFAIAAHLEPEIMLIDEVLAVGDSAFQKKCLGKMDDVSKEGRTILFVSHNMSMVSSLCDKGLLLENGKLAYSGSVNQTVASYFMNDQAGRGRVDYRKERILPGDNKATLLEIAIEDSSGEVRSEISINKEFSVFMEYELLENNMYVYPNIHFYTSDGTCAFITSDSVLDPELCMKKSSGKYISICRIPANFLNDDVYYVGFALTSIKPSLHVHFHEKDALQIHIVDKIEGTVTRNGYAGAIPGAVRPILTWSCEKK